MTDSTAILPLLSPAPTYSITPPHQTNPSQRPMTRGYNTNNNVSKDDDAGTMQSNYATAGTESVETPTGRIYSAEFAVDISADEEAELMLMYDQAKAEIVRERRSFNRNKYDDVVVNKNNRLISNEIVSLKHSVRSVLDEITLIESGQYSPPIDGPPSERKFKIRGPPLASQETLFSQAYESNQIKNYYTGFGSRNSLNKKW
jgi:hypothetical protein